MFRLREGLRGLTELPRAESVDDDGVVSLYPHRVLRCGRVRIGGDVQVWVRESEDDSPQAHFRGLVRCGSAWACPCCALALRAGRAEEVRQCAERHAEHGGAVLFLSLTIRHGSGEALQDTVRGVAGSVRALRARRGFRRAMDALGLVGDVRALEVTHGPHGWHPHAHLALFVVGSPPAELIGALERAIALEWRQAVLLTMGSGHEPSLAHGADLREWTTDELGAYLAKLGCELVDPSGKAARKSNRTPMQIAEGAVGGSAADAALWNEYVSAMWGRRFMDWSRGRRDMRALYGVRARSDAEIIEGDATGELVLLVPPDVWDGGLRDRALAVLEAVEASRGPPCGMWMDAG